MEYVVRVRDENHNVSWEKRIKTLKEAKKVRKWHENDHGYAVSIEEDE